MINARQYELLKELKKCAHYVPLRHFAEKFACSEKTVSTDIRALNLTLASGDLYTRIETKAGNGVRMIVRDGEGSALESVILLNAGNAMTSFDRFYRGILYLAREKPTSCTSDLLAAHLFTNRRCIQSEVRYWNNILSFFGLAIKSKRGTLRIEGDEYALRTAILYFFYMVTPYYQHRVIEASLSEKAQALSSKIMDIMLTKREISYARNARSAFGFYMDLAAARIACGYRVGPVYEVPFAGGDDVVENIRAAMEESLMCSLPISEARIIVSSQVLGALCDPCALAGELDGETREFAYSLRDVLERQFGTPLDMDMVRSLESLSYQAIQRWKSKFPIGLFNAAPMKRHHVDWLITLEGLLASVPQLARVPLFADDVARIAMLLYPYWDKHRKRTYRVLLVADASFEQAAYGVYCIETGLPFIQVVGVVSGEDLLCEGGVRSSAYEDVDFILAFEPMESALPLCQISHSVGKDDLMHVMEFTLNFEELWRGSPFEVSSRKLSQESIRDTVQAVYWDLRNDGIVKATFEEFAEQFESHCAISTDHMTTALCLKRTATTGLRVYETSELHVVQPVASLSVLYVAERDRTSLSEIVARFNRSIKTSIRGEHAYSIPPSVTH
ncbi:HTH domain-containing protein [Gordonibacter sp.]|uniref:HTH domain-containing protein n=1 Tax=Gordonibacter sp. TaxID=1968902 RepID=UPI002FCA1A88